MSECLDSLIWFPGKCKNLLVDWGPEQKNAVVYGCASQSDFISRQCWKLKLYLCSLSWMFQWKALAVYMVLMILTSIHMWKNSANKDLCVAPPPHYHIAEQLSVGSLLFWASCVSPNDGGGHLHNMAHSNCHLEAQLWEFLHHPSLYFLFNFYQYLPKCQSCSGGQGKGGGLFWIPLLYGGGDSPECWCSPCAVLLL